MAIMNLQQTDQSNRRQSPRDTVSRTWHEGDLARRIELRYLIRRFEIQLRYGCTAEECHSAHCFTGRKQSCASPARRPSPLTARIMAFHLASSTNPYSKLCSNQPSVLPQHLDLAPDALEQLPNQIKSPLSVELIRYTSEGGNQSQQGHIQRTKHTALDSQTIKDYWLQNLRLTPGSQPDRKSLMQNLFSTKAVRQFLWTSVSPTAELPIMRTVFGLRASTTVASVELTPKVHPDATSRDDSRKVKVSLLNHRKKLHLTIEHMKELKESYKQAIAAKSSNAITEIELILQDALGTRDGLLRSFRHPLDDRIPEIVDALDWTEFKDSTLLLRYLRRAIDALFIPPATWISTQGLEDGTTISNALKDDDVTHIFRICWLVLIAWVWPASTVEGNPVAVASHVLDATASGRMYEDRYIHGDSGSIKEDVVTSRIGVFDAFGDEAAQALAAKVVHAMGVRNVFYEAGYDSLKQGKGGINLHRNMFQAMMKTAGASRYNPSGVIVLFECWLITVINCGWKGQLKVSRWEAVGAALESFSIDSWHAGHAQNNKLHWISSRLPAYRQEDLLTYGENYGKDLNFVYLWSVPTLFPTSRQVSNFRALNYARMSSAYREGIYAEQLAGKLDPAPPAYLQRFLDRKLQTAASRYLVLNVRRGHLLEDALEQLWGREKRELMRPLKVRMGMDLGEAGVDQGGVSQEFFRLVYQKAFDPEFGLFQKTDDDSTCVWPQPNSHEPLATFQLLGLLTALGIYNGFTLPVSFPSLLYLLLCRGSFSNFSSQTKNEDFLAIEVIMDAWPSLCDNLQSVQDYNSDKLEEELALDWTYTFKSGGENKHIDMFAAMDGDPTSPVRRLVAANPEQSTPVTGANVNSYVTEYIRWTVKESVSDQLEAFAHGFKAVIDDAALCMLTPHTLQQLAEGEQYIDIDDLQEVAKLEGGYEWDDSLIQWFWEIVEGYPAAQHRALLNFVTAIDRVPVTGMQSIHFSIVKNGPDSELLPSSSTCFGKLLIPEYSSKEKLKAKLDLALENSIGFGSA